MTCQKLEYEFSKNFCLAVRKHIVWFKYFCLLLTNLRVIINAAFLVLHIIASIDVYRLNFEVFMQRVFKKDIRPILEDSDQFLMRSVWDILTEYQVNMNWYIHMCDWNRWVPLFTSTYSGY